MNAAAAVMSLCTRKRIDFMVLLETIARRSNNAFEPIGVAATFEVYRWMIQSLLRGGREKDCLPYRWPTQWGERSLLADLSGLPGCTNVSQCRPLTSNWREQLFDRLAHALLDKGPMADWRTVMRIDLARPRHVPMNWRSDWAVARDLDALFALNDPSRRLVESLNSVHADAIFLTDVQLFITRDHGWSAGIEYGVDGSRWNEDHRATSPMAYERADGQEDAVHTYQREDEFFGDFIVRTRETFEKLLTPPCRTLRWSCIKSRPSFQSEPHVDGVRSCDVCARRPP
jgi:hypothetical protein